MKRTNILWIFAFTALKAHLAFGAAACPAGAFTSVTKIEGELDELINKSQNPTIASPQVATDWQTVFLALEKDAKKIYQERLTQAFSGVALPKEILEKQCFLPLFLQRGPSDGRGNLKNITSENFQERAQQLGAFVKFLRANSHTWPSVSFKNEDERIVSRYLEHYQAGLQGFLRTTRPENHFPTDLYRALNSTTDKRKRAEYLEMLDKIVEGTKRFLNSGGPLTLTLYRSLCQGQESFEETLRALQKSAREREITQKTALRYQSAIQYRLANQPPQCTPDQHPKKSGVDSLMGVPGKAMSAVKNMALSVFGTSTSSDSDEEPRSSE